MGLPVVLPVEGSCPWRVRKDTLNTPVKQEASVVARILGLQAEENVNLIPRLIGDLIAGYSVYKKSQDGSWDFTGDV